MHVRKILHLHTARERQKVLGNEYPECSLDGLPAITAICRKPGCTCFGGKFVVFCNLGLILIFVFPACGRLPPLAAIMRTTIKHIILTFLILTTNVAIGQSVDTIYQNILADFCNNHLNDNLFDNECTKLKFNKRFNVAVYTDSSLWTVEPFIIGNYFDSSLVKAITNEIDSATWNWLNAQATIKNLKIDFTKLSKLEKTTLTIAPKETTSKEYLLRLSSPNLWNNYTYIELWIKQTYYSSGTRILYKIDSNGMIVDKKKYNLCDDNG